MTVEEAIEILKQDKALYETETVRAGDGTTDGELLLALEIALSALRAQQESGRSSKVVESNEPLTLDELRKMDGEPVWWWNTSANPVCMICVRDRFMDEPMFANYDWQREDTLKLSKYKWLKKCGYKPYRHKPEEVQK